MAVLGYAIALIADFDRGADGLQYVTDDDWISELGIRYQLGVDGLNLFLVALTALLWVPATIWAALRETDRPKLFFFHMALAETAVLGAFMAQDLALFVVFFDLMLVPFYFLIGGWGEGDRVRGDDEVRDLHAGRLAADAGRRGRARRAGDARRRRRVVLVRRRSRSARSARARSSGSSCCSRSAFLVKAPLFPLHGWVVGHLPRDADCRCWSCCRPCCRRSASTASCGSCCRSCPTPPQHFQDLMLVLAVFSILYGSILAFSQDERAAGGRPTPRSPSSASSRSASSRWTTRAPRAR